MHWLPLPCPHPAAVQETVVCGHHLDPKDPPWVWSLTSLGGGMASILDTWGPLTSVCLCSHSLMTLVISKVRRQDGGEGPSCLLLCRVGRDGAQAFPGGFSPTVPGVEGIGSSLSLSLSHSSYWSLPGTGMTQNAPGPLLLFSGKSSIGEEAGPLPKASGPGGPGCQLPPWDLAPRGRTFPSLLLYLKQCVVINHENDVFPRPLLPLS